MMESLEGGERAALNDAELANVSGGGAAMEAMDWCRMCDRGEICGKRYKHELIDYIEEHGHLKSYTECPSYGKA